MRVWFCGTRGSTPSPGTPFNRYGGHTSCVALSKDESPPGLVLDAGIGLRNLDRILGGAAFDGTILFGHLHWDHTHGLPFFVAGGRPGHRTRLMLPEQGVDPEELLERAISPPHFPVTPRQLGPNWSFAAIDEGEHPIEGFSVLALEIPHKGGRTFGYRVSDGTSSIAYLSDHCPMALGPGPSGAGELHDNALALASGVDLLIHDAQYLRSELPERWHFGHSSPDYALELGIAAGSKEVVFFHHAQERTDAQLDELADAFSGSSLPVRLAYDGLVLDLGLAARQPGAKAPESPPPLEEMLPR